MSGTKAGGLKAAKTNMKRHGKDFYKICGAKGGSVSCAGGFASLKVGPDGLTGPERAKIAGAKGGHNSRRGSAEEVEANRLKREKKRQSETWRLKIKWDDEE